MRLKPAFERPLSIKGSIHKPLFAGLGTNLKCIRTEYTVAGRALRNLGLNATLHNLG